MLKRYYRLQEAKELLCASQKAPIGIRDINEAAIRGELRLCFWYEGLLSAIGAQQEGRHGVEPYGYFKGYIRIPAHAIERDADVYRIRTGEVVEAIDWPFTFDADEFPVAQVTSGASDTRTDILIRTPFVVDAADVVMPAVDVTALTKTEDKDKPLSPKTKTTYLHIIGGLLHLLLEGKGPSGKRYAVFEKDEAIFDALHAHFPNKRQGLSKRNLEKYFAEARRALDQPQ